MLPSATPRSQRHLSGTEPGKPPLGSGPSDACSALPMGLWGGAPRCCWPVLPALNAGGCLVLATAVGHSCHAAR